MSINMATGVQTGGCSQSATLARRLVIYRYDILLSLDSVQCRMVTGVTVVTAECDHRLLIITGVSPGLTQPVQLCLTFPTASITHHQPFSWCLVLKQCRHCHCSAVM